MIISQFNKKSLNYLKYIIIKLELPSTNEKPQSNHYYKSSLTTDNSMKNLPLKTELH